MKLLSFSLDVLLCAISYPAALITKPIPEISDEPPKSPGGWFHKRKNRAVETVEKNAQWFTKCFGFVIGLEALTIGGLVWLIFAI